MEKSPNQQDVSFDELWYCLRAAAIAIPRLYCIADALDEMEPGHAAFLDKLVLLGRVNPTSLKVVATSRKSPHIEAVFKELATINLALDPRLIRQDIVTFIYHCLSHHGALKISDTEKSMIQEAVQAKAAEEKLIIRQTVEARAAGLFLYARLMMDEIVRCLGSMPLGGILAGLPAGLGDMYTTLLHQHSLRSGASKTLQRLILQWVTHSSRPLRLLEISDVVRATEYGKQFTTVQAAKTIIRSACGPLLTLLPDETLQVIHHSFTEFLIDTQRSTEPTATFAFAPFDPAPVHESLATICAKYLIE